MHHHRVATMRIVGHRMRLTQAHVERMRIPRRFWDASFNQISEEIRPKVEKYLRQLDDHLDEGEGLLLWGDNGVGKTSIAVLIALEVRRRGASVFFITAEGLRQAVLEKELYDDEQLVIERARSVDFLVLDDLGKEHPGETGFSERLLENLFRERSAMRRATVITTNLPMGSTDGNERTLMNAYIPSMVEVMKEVFYPLRCVGENFRDEALRRIKKKIAVNG